MYGPTDYYTKWSMLGRERQMPYAVTYMWNLKNDTKWTYDWCWSWNSNTLATSCKELTYWKRPWCSEGLGAGGEGEDRGWDGWMASPTGWAWVWVNSWSWWWTGRPGVLRFMGSQRSGHDWATELTWTEQNKTDLLIQRTELWLPSEMGSQGKDGLEV